MARFALGSLRVRAVLGDVEFPDIAAFSSTFAINSIPEATLQLGVGIDLSTGRPATIHAQRNALAANTPVKVFLEVVEGQAENMELGLPVGESLIFEGNVAGIGAQMHSDISFLVPINHWLDHLNFASALSASLHPGNPASLVMPAVSRALAAAGRAEATGVSGEMSWVPAVSSSVINPTTLTDLWGNGLYKFIQILTEDDPFDASLLAGDGAPDANILDAVSRIAPNAAGMPLALDLAGVDGDIIAHAIRESLVNDAGANWVNTTIWGKLIGEWAPNYWFAVIPRVSDALIVPFTGALSGNPWRTLGVADNTMENLQAKLQRPLRAVAVMHGSRGDTGLDSFAGGATLSVHTAAGFFSPDDQTDGMVLFKLPPRWLSDTHALYRVSGEVEGIDGDPVANPLDEVGVGQAPQNNPAANVESRKGMLDRYCEQWYMLEALKARSGEIVSRLRFDVAPGSAVKIEPLTGKHIGDDQLSADMYGTVIQVSTTINCENPNAGSIFEVSHLRTAEENAQPGYATSRPALYTKPWLGAELVPTA